MNTFILEREYGNDIKIEVEDDITCRVEQHYGENRGREGMTVHFEEKTDKYDTRIIAAFDGIRFVRREDISVQSLCWIQDEAIPSADISKGEQVWTDC